MLCVNNMKVICWIINFLCAAIALFIGLPFFVSMALLFFIFSDQLIVGQPMYIDLNTPKISSILIFQGICVTIISMCFVIRAKIAKKDDFRLSRVKHKYVDHAVD